MAATPTSIAHHHPMSDFLPTLDQIAAAKQFCIEARTKLGLDPDPESTIVLPAPVVYAALRTPAQVCVMPVKALRMTQDRKAKLLGTLDVLTEDWQFSTDDIRDALALIDSANGRRK